MAKAKEFGHFVKPLSVVQTPAGLYAEPRFWMEAKDMEGFNAHFSYGFVKEPGVCHPVDGGALIHPYDECLVFAGFKDGDILKLGAEVSIELGEEREEHVFDKPTVVLVPKGTPHGPVTYRRVDTPIVHYNIGLGPEYRATTLPKGPKTSGSKYGHLVRRLISKREEKKQDGSGMGYEEVMDENGIMRPSERGVGPGNGDQIVWLFGKDLEGFDVNFTWGLYSKCGKWHRRGEAHTHPEEEILVFVGLDPDDMGYLGAELEFALGPDYERQIYNKPTVVICPKGFPHLPLVTRWADKPYGFFVICLSGEHESPWVEA
jgi:hypothetical protein